MKKIDVSFNQHAIRHPEALINKNLNSYYCDEFYYRPAVYQVVYLEIDSHVYALQNMEKTINYFDADEDVSVLQLSKWNSPLTSHVQDGKLINTPIDSKIHDIQIIEDTYQMFESGILTYEITFTKGLIFELENKELMFEKDIWLSEDIFIYQGQHVKDKIMPVELDKPDDYDNLVFKAIRNIRSLRNAD